MKNLLKILKWTGLVLLGLILVLVLVYFLGPRPQKPVLDNSPQAAISSPLAEIEQLVAQKDEDVAGLRPNNEGKIYWADSIRQTDYCLVYLHGFSASGMEADPMHRELAQRYGMNFYAPRLFEHGITTQDALLNFNAKDYVNSAKEALAIGKKMGKKVLLLSCSTGGSLSLYLAAKDTEISSLLLLSPNIKIANPAASLLSGPWGLQIARMVYGSHRSWDPPNKGVKQYWTHRYRTEALIQMQLFLEATMKKKVFQQVKQPVFLGYYYKNEEEQDQVVSVAAMLKMFEQLGTPDELKKKVAFPKAENHIICSVWHSKDLKNVQQQLQVFIENSLKITAKQ